MSIYAGFTSIKTSSGLRRGDPGVQAGEETPLHLPPNVSAMCYLQAVRQAVRKNQAGICTTWCGTAAGHAVAARGGFRDAGPVNREPTARPQVAAGIPVLQGGGGCQVAASLWERVTLAVQIRFAALSVGI